MQRCQGQPVLCWMEHESVSVPRRIMLEHVSKNQSDFFARCS